MTIEQERARNQAYLLERWKQLFGQYDALKQAVESQTVREEWASGKRYDLRPLYFLRNTIARGEVVDEQAANQAGVWWYRFDAADRVVFECVYPTEQPNDTFIQYANGAAEICRFTPYHPYVPLLVELTHIYYEGDHPVRYGSLQLNGVQFPPPVGLDYSPEGVLAWLGANMAQTGHNALVQRHELYHYEMGRVSSITVWSDFAARPRPQYETEERIRYDASGQIERIDAFENGRRYRVLYQRVLAGLTYDHLRADAEKLLRTMILTTLRVMRIETRVCALVLFWRVDSPFELSPRAAVQFEDERALRLQAGDYDGVWENLPAEQFLPVLTLQNDDVCRLFEQEAQLREDWFAVRDVLRSVARDLTRTKLLWTTDVLNITDDFVVYVLALNSQVDSLEEALLVSAGETPVERWREMGYLPLKR